MKEEGKPSKSLSLKWQLSLALISFAMGLVVFYVALAKETFESDKIAYVFETRQSQLQSTTLDFTKKLERAVRDANIILAGFDLETKTLNPIMQRMFDSQTELVAVQVQNQITNEIRIQITKNDDVKESLRKPGSISQSKGAYFIQALGHSRFLVSANEEGGREFLIKAIIEMPQLLTSREQTSFTALLENEKLIGITKPFEIPASLLKELSLDRIEKTMMTAIEKENYLISSMSIPNSNLKLISLDSETSVLGAIGVLYQRSLVFLIFSGFFTAIMALLLSKTLTKSLSQLTQIAGKIGQGDFSLVPQVTSGNEIGLLQIAFSRMSLEIQNLLVATKEKTRMEEELKTASLVQERLFPKEPVFQTGSLRLCGIYDTTTECGGDWWYYFQNGDDLFIVVADATGQGTPAAFSTVASRAMFSHFRRIPNLSLVDLATAWDRAIAESSGQKVFMTAFMIKINVHTGQGQALSASHEPPLLINDLEEASYLYIEKSGTLGELRSNWLESAFALKPLERLFIFTDGLWAVENLEKKTFSDIRVAKKLAKLSSTKKRSEDFLEAINQMVQEHRKGEAYPDDLTMVLLDRLAAA